MFARGREQAVVTTDSRERNASVLGGCKLDPSLKAPGFIRL